MPKISNVSIQDEHGNHVPATVYYNQENRFYLRHQPAGWPEYAAATEQELISKYRDYFDGLRNLEVQTELFISISAKWPGKNDGFGRTPNDMGLEAVLVAKQTNSAGQVKRREGARLRHVSRDGKTTLLPDDWAGPTEEQWQHEMWYPANSHHVRDSKSHTLIEYTAEAAAELNRIFCRFVELGDMVREWRLALGEAKALPDHLGGLLEAPKA